MKTAISVPDELFERADRIAERLSISRSELYSKALAEFLARRDPVEMTAAWDEVCEDVGQTRDEWVQAASSKILRDTDW
jgi:predicted transcriptional regulator